MNLEPSFQRYLTSKRSVDDRALNRLVWKALEERLASLEGRPLLQVLELGGGVGTMLERMVEWDLLSRAEYTLVDELPANIQTARERLRGWAARQGMFAFEENGRLTLAAEGAELRVELQAAEMSAFLRAGAGRHWDLLVAHAFLDLVDAEAALPLLKAALRPGGLMLLTLNFDGLSAFEPQGDPELDERILAAYHRTMDERGAGGSRTGRKLFGWLREAGLRILEAGSSDWIVYPRAGGYAADEAYFLRFILGFFDQALRGRAEVSAAELAGWLAQRRGQLERGELVFMAHQYDFLVEAE